jgi:hypothetical protein
MTGAIRDYNHPSIVHDFKKIFFRAQTCTRFICTHVSFLKQVVIFGSIILQCDDKPSPGFYHTNHLIIKIIVQTTTQPTACYPPKKPGICQGLFFCLQAYRLKGVPSMDRLGELR